MNELERYDVRGPCPRCGVEVGGSLAFWDGIGPGGNPVAFCDFEGQCSSCGTRVRVTATPEAEKNKNAIQWLTITKEVPNQPSEPTP